MAGLRVPGSVNSIAVHLTGACLGQVDVPYVVRLLGHARTPDLRGAVSSLEQTKIDRFRVLTEDREVHAAAVPGRTQRVRPARVGPDISHHVGAPRLAAYPPSVLSTAHESGLSLT